MAPASDTSDVLGSEPRGDADEVLSQALEAFRLSRADPARARPLAAAAVAAARAAGDVEALTVALRAEAWAARFMIDGGRARRLLDQAARHATRAGLLVRLGDVLVDRAAVNMELGRSRSATRDLIRAKELLGSRVPVDLEFMFAVHDQNAGRLAEASEVYRDLLHRPKATTSICVRAANNLAMIESEFGHHAAAVRLFEQARAGAPNVGAAMTALAAGGHAWALARAGRVPESVRVFAEAEGLFEAAGLPIGHLHVEYADVMMELRLLPEAAAAAGRAAAEFSEASVPLMEAEARLRVARAALLAGRTQPAEQAGELAADSFQRQRRTGWAAQSVVVVIEARRLGGRSGPEDLLRVRRAAGTLERLGMVAESVDAHLCAGNVARDLGRVRMALGSFDQANRLALRSPVVVRLRGRVAAAAAATLRGDRAAALRQCRDGLADLERHRAGLSSVELRARASAHGVDLGQIGMAAARGSGGPLRLLGWMERTRAAALVGIRRAAPLDSHADEFARLRAVQTEIEGAADEHPSARADMESARVELETRLRRLSWEQEQRPVNHRPRPVRELTASLDGRLLVEYGVTAGRVIAVVVDGQRSWMADLGPLAEVQDVVERLSFSLRSLSRGLSARTTASHMTAVASRLDRLREWLIQPLGLPVDRELVVVPAGMLQRVPWTALHSGPVALAPSAHYWAVTEERVRRRTAATRNDAQSVLVAAGPGLPGAEAEVAMVGAAYASPQVMCPPDTSVAAVAEALTDVGTAHFACHGRVRADNPMFSGLRLSDGELTVQELELRDLAPHRVVLAACEVGADVAVPGDELIGFVSALIARGSAGVLGSLHLAPDMATARLMARVHSALAAGATLAAALHAARAALDLDDPVDLVNACGFTVFGAA